MCLSSFQPLHAFHSENRYFRMTCLMNSNYNTLRIYEIFQVRVKKNPVKNKITVLFIIFILLPLLCLLWRDAFSNVHLECRTSMQHKKTQHYKGVMLGQITQLYHYFVNRKPETCTEPVLNASYPMFREGNRHQKKKRKKKVM